MPLSVRTLCTLGSSSTAGSGATTEDHRYANLVAAALGARLVNLGSGGQTVSQVLATYLPRALEALDGGPRAPGVVDVVTFLPFTDFAYGEAAPVAEGYDGVLGQLGPTGAWVVFGIPAVDARYTCGRRGGLTGPAGECYDEALVQEYEAKGRAMVEVLDRHPLASPAWVFMQMAENPDWTAPDGHPNDDGHAYIAGRFTAAIQARLGADAGR
jgi:lysophospholipase L1-like esterase